MNPLWILLLLAVVAAGVVFWMRRGAPDPRLSAPPMPDDDLRALGLSAARPRADETPTPQAAPSSATPVRTSHASTPEAAPSPGSVLRNRAAWAPHANAVTPLLDAFAATLGGPVAILTTADGVASVDALAEPDGTPRLPQRRLSAERTGALAGDTTDTLTRSVAAGDALRAFRAATADTPSAAAARRLGSARLLVVGGALTDATLAIADRYGDLLAALADDSAPAARHAPTAEGEPDTEPTAENEPDDVTAVPLRTEPGLELVDLDAQLDADPAPRQASEPSPPAPDDAHAEPSHARPGMRSVTPTAPVPRAVLLAAETSSAREAGRPLAFALVTRTDAEAALADGDAHKATVALCTEIALADEVRRAEPFGELVVGAFLDADADAACAWAQTLEPGAFRVGLVAPADYDAEALRADAEDALRRAWVEDRAFVLSSDA